MTYLGLGAIIYLCREIDKGAVPPRMASKRGMGDSIPIFARSSLAIRNVG